MVSPQYEEYRGNVNTIGIRSCYDEGKRIAETLITEFHRVHFVNTRIARIFNTYGPQMDKEDGRVVSNFINQALRDQDITLYGNGQQTRSFCYIDDQIDGLMRLMESNYNSPINIGNPHEISLKEFAEEIQQLIGGNSKIIYEPLPQDDPKQRQPDITKAKEILGWEPKVNRTEGLKITLDYFKNVLNQTQSSKSAFDDSEEVNENLDPDLDEEDDE
jgi:dTDP-glucose 4,6-dehydratase